MQTKRTGEYLKTQLKELRPARRMNEDDEAEEGFSGDCLMPTIKKKVSRQFSYPLMHDIVSPHYYRNIISTCQNADEDDEIEFIISSDGGSLDTCIAIRNAIKTTKAHTVAGVISNCHSAASVIALACDSIWVADGASMNLHNAKYGFHGKAYDNEQLVDFHKKQLRKFVEGSYRGFLDQEEIELVLKGKEVYLDSDEISERLTKRQALQKKEMDVELKRLKKEQKAIESEIAERSKPKSTVKAPKKPSEARKTEKATKGASSLPEALDKLLEGLE